MTKKFKDRPLIIAAPPLFFFICLTISVIIHFIIPVGVFILSLIARICIGLLLMISSGIIALLSFKVLKEHHTPFNPNRPTNNIVQTSIFGVSRNPLYLSLVLVFIGMAFLMNSLVLVIMTIIFGVIIDRGVIKPEEVYLEKKFGDEYLQYKSKVRKWL